LPSRHFRFLAVTCAARTTIKHVRVVHARGVGPAQVWDSWSLVLNVSVKAHAYSLVTQVFIAQVLVTLEQLKIVGLLRCSPTRKLSAPTKTFLRAASEGEP
jgi:hypothetical protein